MICFVVLGEKRSWPPEVSESPNYRPTTPDFKRFVYGFVGLWRDEEVSVHGTACAFSEKLVFTAYHNIKDNSLKAFGLVKQLLGDRKIPKSEFIDLELVCFDVGEDWAILKRRSGAFDDYCSNFCDEGQLPAPGSYVAVFDFPVGLITATLDGAMKLSCDSMLTSVYQYEGRSKKVTNGMKNTWKLVDERPNPLEVERVITVKGGRSVGSCGAPYFTMRGSIVGFHTASLNDGESVVGSSSSHTSYSCANVFCRLPNFVNSKNRGFTTTANPSTR